MEITANVLQTVNANQNILFTDVVTEGNCSIVHRPGSGLVSLRGNTCQCRARFKITFGGNVGIPTGGTVEAISLAISVDGEPVGPTTMIVVQAAVENLHNVFSAIFLDVPKGYNMQVAVENTSEQAIIVQNANLIVERVA